jgi:hypothetical protein
VLTTVPVCKFVHVVPLYEKYVELYAVLVQYEVATTVPDDEL